MKELIEKLEQADVGKIEKDVFLDKYTTYKAGGVARAIVYPKNEGQLVALLKLLKSENISYKILGNGSNLLFSDKAYEGVLIRLSEFSEIEFFGNNKVRVGAGFSLIKLCHLVAKKGLTGLEFAAGIPGTVGGGVFMNAGAYKSDMGYVVQEVKVLTPDFKVITLENKEMQFHYRTSFLQTHPEYVCLEVIFRLEKGERAAIEKVMNDRRERRMESQPLEYPSAGSVFRNPEGMFAGKLIEDLGLKGFQIGGAKVSEKHANFIINYDHATSSDIKSLIEYVKERVKQEYHIELKVEQEFVNWE